MLKYIFAIITIMAIQSCTQDYGNLVYELKQQTVLITNETTESIPIGDLQHTGYGAGVAFNHNKKTYVITASHVVSKIITSVENSEQCLSVLTLSGNTQPANILITGSIQDLDFAVLELEEYVPEFSSLKIGPPPFSGEEVHTVGHPRGPEGSWSYTYGRVSNARRLSSMDTWSVQIAMSVAPGHSGGGVFDNKGRLIAIVSGIREPYTYAVPMELILKRIHGCETLRQLK